MINQQTDMRTDIEHWWAAAAMIASYNHVYQVTYKTKYEVRGPIGVSIYEGAPIASFQYEFLALSPDSQAVLDAVLAYPIRDDKQYVIDVFHSQPSEPALKNKFTQFDHEFVRTGTILGLNLPVRVDTIPVNVHKATTINQAETANHSLTTEGERIHVQTLRDSIFIPFMQLWTGRRSAGYNWLRSIRRLATSISFMCWNRIAGASLEMHLCSAPRC